MATGTVKSLWRWPVLPLAGERLRATRLDERGVAGDRRHLIVGPHGPLTAQDAPELTSWRASFPFNPDGAIVRREAPYPILHGAGGSFRWGDPRLHHRLEQLTGLKLEFVRDADAVHPVVVAAVAPDQAAELAGVNVQLDIALPGGGWAGSELRFAEGVRLRLVSSRADGPGIATEVISGGRIVIGEAVDLS
jgi:hypothetical protein